MKKILALLLISVLIVGCDNPTQKEEATEVVEEGAVQEAVEEEEMIFEIEEIGQGSFYLENESGTTENGDPLIIYEDGETQLLQIGIMTNEFDGSKLTFVYVDNELLTKEQYSNSQSTLTLEQKHLKEGQHQVVLKQFENDDDSTEPITVKFAEYEVKAK